MKRLEPGDRIYLSGGYDYDPRWHKPDGSGYYATVLRFIDNKIEKRIGDERLSVIIEFDEILDFDGLRGKYGLIMGRWQGQKWTPEGVAHLHLLAKDIMDISEFSQQTSRWLESHADYKTT
jgi:hypothetical protein